MKDILNNIATNNAIIITAPPGWGKTYKILQSVKSTQTKVVFVFPLRALCDEVYINALEKKIDVLNIRTIKDYQLLKLKNYKLIVCTPEVFQKVEDNAIYILDEFHLFYYWGDSFRPRMFDVYMDITSLSLPVILLTATLAESLKSRLQLELQNNYNHIYHLNFGNQQLKNFPNRFFYYPSKLKDYLVDDFMYADTDGTSLIFCQYRAQVTYWSNVLNQMGYKVISCVGGEAAEFVEKISSCQESYDFIIATSVVSHGVNLPDLRRLYFLYHVDNLDFYLQMLGRGGREGKGFQIHIQNNNYFSKKQLLQGLCNVLIKRFSNKINSLLYSLYES